MITEATEALGVLTATTTLPLLTVWAWDHLRAIGTDRWRRMWGHPWAALSGRLGLQYRPGMGPTGHRLVGQFSGRRIEMWLQDTETGRLRLSNTHPARITCGAVQTRMPLASELLFAGSGESAVDAGLLPAHSLSATAERIDISDERIEICIRGMIESELGVFLMELGGLCLRLEARSRAPWQEAARRFGLANQIMNEERALSGPDLTVRIPQGGMMTIIRAAVRDHRVRIRRRRPGERGGLRLQQPILDNALCIEGPEWLAHRLQEPDACGTLLRVLHAFPDSEIAGGELVVRVPGRMGAELPDRVAEVRAVVDLLADQQRYQRRHPLAG
ncbi:MAG: hypothetical protein AAFV53_34360 [Myxococcota bacterium]